MAVTLGFALIPKRRAAEWRLAWFEVYRRLRADNDGHVQDDPVDGAVPQIVPR